MGNNGSLRSRAVRGISHRIYTCRLAQRVDKGRTGIPPQGIEFRGKVTRSRSVIINQRHPKTCFRAPPLIVLGLHLRSMYALRPLSNAPPRDQVISWRSLRPGTCNTACWAQFGGYCLPQPRSCLATEPLRSIALKIARYLLVMWMRNKVALPTAPGPGKAVRFSDIGLGSAPGTALWIVARNCEDTAKLGM